MEKTPWWQFIAEEEAKEYTDVKQIMDDNCPIDMKLKLIEGLNDEKTYLAKGMLYSYEEMLKTNQINQL